MPRKFSKQSTTRRERRALKAMERTVRKLERHGAKCVDSPARLAAAQSLMIKRFAMAGVDCRMWKKLTRCRPGRCGHRPNCSAACWFGDRGKVNALILEAAELLKASNKPLWFVTIIDPRQAVPADQLPSFSLTGAMASLRRRFRVAADLFGDDRAFGFVELALEVLPDGREFWFPHYHFVIATSATRRQIREALKPARRPPDPSQWGRKAWKPVDVRPVHHLVNALAYSGKRTPETNGNVLSPENRRWRQGGRLPATRRDEHDRWLLEQHPSARIFKKGFKELHGKLRPFQPRR